ncbi:hypothetical protein GCM10027614_33360 [Micromonospora vulcania]
MFDTYVTIVGNVLTTPEWRRTSQSSTLVANFKVASTARRLDRDSGRWVDGNSFGFASTAGASWPKGSPPR